MTANQDSILEMDQRLRQMARQIWSELRQPSGRSGPGKDIAEKGAEGAARDKSRSAPPAKRIRPAPVSELRPADARAANGRAAPPPKAPAPRKQRRSTAPPLRRRQAV
jgi:hypothetical protein